MQFDGKRVSVTGAGKGIGRSTAKLLHSRGATVVAMSRSVADLVALASELDCETIAVDLANPAAARSTSCRCWSSP